MVSRGVEGVAVLGMGYRLGFASRSCDPPLRARLGAVPDDAFSPVVGCCLATFMKGASVSTSVQSVSVAFEVLTGGDSLDDWIWHNAVKGVSPSEMAIRLSAVTGAPVTVDFVTAWLNRA